MMHITLHHRVMNSEIILKYLIILLYASSARNQLNWNKDSTKSI